jgi:hypothetical protein
MLKSSRFGNVQKGIEETFEIIRSEIGANIKFDKSIKEKKSRRTWYLDTRNYKLNEGNKFLLRIRQDHETGEYDTTLKCRHPDRYLSASYDLSSPKKNLKFKFEEDISTPFISKFSHSASFYDNKQPDLGNFRDLKQIFPNLNVDISETESLRKVNNFEPNELSYKIGTLEFTEKKSVNLFLNLWYLANGVKNAFPLIVELTFNYQAKIKSLKKETSLEEFPISVVRKTNNLYHLLQKMDITEPNTTKTKTEYAYEYKQK